MDFFWPITRGRKNLAGQANLKELWAVSKKEPGHAPCVVRGAHGQVRHITPKYRATAAECRVPVIFKAKQRRPAFPCKIP